MKLARPLFRGRARPVQGRSTSKDLPRGAGVPNLANLSVRPLVGRSGVHALGAVPGDLDPLFEATEDDHRRNVTDLGDGLDFPTCCNGVSGESSGLGVFAVHNRSWGGDLLGRLDRLGV